MKITKTQLKEHVRKVIKKQLDEQMALAPEGHGDGMDWDPEDDFADDFSDTEMELGAGPYDDFGEEDDFYAEDEDILDGDEDELFRGLGF